MWLDNFYLGRPGSEYLFTDNPAQMDVTRAQICATHRVLSGRYKKWVFRTEFPVIQLSGNFNTIADADKMASLLAVTDTHLSFRVRDYFTMYGEQNYPSNVGTTVVLQENSATLLSAALVAAGAASSVTIIGVYDNAALTGTNYYTGGSYADATRIITLGTPLPTALACYVTYRYTGWLVSMEAINFAVFSGKADRTQYSGWELIGV